MFIQGFFVLSLVTFRFKLLESSPLLEAVPVDIGDGLLKILV